MRRLLRLLLLVAMLPFAARASEPVLEIDIGGSVRHLERSALLQLPQMRTVDVGDDVAYHRTMRYRALPLAALLGDAKLDGDVQFTATDGFVANIPARLLLGKGQPWLAVEPPDAPWPGLQPNAASAGPFYLVWLAPQEGKVGQEQWPYQIAKIAAALPLAARYPHRVPPGGAAQRGLQVYVANCASCHSINGAGDAAIGPDLNLPANPTEYFRESYLRKLIRDPASVRNWKQRIMPGFSSTALSDADLDDLLAYFRQMAKQR
jgi:mono/diheme cytochrome c family protein